MELFYLALIVILFGLAISDLVVGVSNDAVNFLNSAVGSKASSFRVIMFVAALGILVGGTFSSGMMEVARKGIFHPEYFYFSEIILIFLAVMVTDVILLDTFNSFGMPTSTTVSIVFELLGAAVAMSLIKILNDPNALNLYEYINSAKALAIISGILLSVVVAFSAGSLVQYISRLIFSFDFDKRMKKFGWIFGGLGIMAITYFILIKGAKGASFMSDDIKLYIKDNSEMIMLISFVAWSLILLLLNRLFKIDILKVLVLVGTFALAMAFAGNDLVNFIGVPLAGYNSYQLFLENGGEANQMLMDGLAGKVPTPTILLLIAGVIMVITLYTSKKAKLVVKTSLDLGRQDEGYERFSSFMLSRSIVRNVSTFSRFMSKRVPKSVVKSIDAQFDQTAFTKKQVHLGEEAPAFDMLRAAVTLVVASILIAIGTNLKLPLSTTYVTFMVFMGTSLADGAWGRESAVYRVSGVLSVIGGWFFTALSAFTVAFVLALIFHYAGIYGIIGTLILAAVLIFRTHLSQGKKIAEIQEFEKQIAEGNLTKAKVIDLCISQLNTFLKQYDVLVGKSIKALGKEKLSDLTKAYQAFKPIRNKIADLNVSSTRALENVPEHELEAGHMYILVIDYLNEMAKHVNNILKSNYDHVDNNHKPLLPEQIEEFNTIHKIISVQYIKIINIFTELDSDAAKTFVRNFSSFTKKTRNIRKNQIKRIKNHEVTTRNSVIYLNHLGEFRNLLMFGNRIVRVFDDLILNSGEEEIAILPSEIIKELEKLDEKTKKKSEKLDGKDEKTKSKAEKSDTKDEKAEKKADSKDEKPDLEDEKAKKKPASKDDKNKGKTEKPASKDDKKE